LLALPVTWAGLQQLDVQAHWRVIASALAVATPITMGELYNRRQQISERGKHLRLLGTGARLQRIRDVSDLAALGVTHSPIAEQAASRHRPPYVPRDKDVELDAALDLGVSKRPYPSGGGRHPIELYVLPFRVEGLDSVAHHFDPFDHSLTQIAGTERFINRMMRNWQCDDPIGGSGLPAAAILLTACFERTMWKYEGLGLVLVYKDAGALLQTLHLQATALNLAGHAVGGGPELAIATGLGLDPVEESYVGAFLVGQADPGRRSTGN
jgi:SagB-type dehydrogenase family enzyme